MKKFALLLVVMFSCTSEGKARETLEAEGFTAIEITGYAWNKCADSDSTCTGFDAISPSGRAVHGAVGCGRLACSKGCTVRLN